MKCLLINKQKKDPKEIIKESTKIVVCDECNHEFLMNAINIDETPIILGNQELILEYFTCPKCNKIYRITLKDKRYEELRLDLENTKARIRKNSGRKDEEFARVLNVMVLKKLERLRSHTDLLNKKFPGTFTFVVSENNNKDKIIKYLP